MFIDPMFLVFILGLSVGIMSGLLGIGGGILIVPLLPLVSNLSHHEIIGTSLFTILIVVVNNTIQFHRKNAVNWRVALIVGPLTAIVAYLSACMGLTLPEAVLKFTLVFTYIVLGFWTITKQQVSANHTSTSLNGRDIVFIALTAIVAGGLSGLTGIGSGMILGAVLLNLRVLPNATLSPTTNAIMVFTCISGVVAYSGWTVDWSTLVWGKIHFKEAFVLSLGAFTSSYFSRQWQHKLPAQKRKVILSTLLFVLGIKVLYSIISP